MSAGLGPVWWTCGCGTPNCSPRRPGSPACARCGKAAAFVIAADQAQQGLQFEEQGEKERQA